MKKVLALGIISFALAAGLSTAQTPIRVGMAYDAGGKFDKSFNESAFTGAQRAVKDLKVSVSEFEPSDPSQAAQGIRNFAQNNFDLVVGVGFNNTPAITSVAKDYPQQKFAVVDDVPDGPNTVGLTFREQEGSYLVGYIAGRTTSTRVLGFVGGMDIPLIHKFDAGYTAGVKAACPSCKVISQYVGTTPSAWNDPAKAKEIATSQYSKGADIIFSAAGASGGGVQDFIKTTKCMPAFKLPGSVKFTAIDAFKSIPKEANYESKCGASSRPVFFIGVDSNQNYLGDTDSNPDTLNYGLTSMVKRVDNAVYSVINDVVKNNAWKSGARTFGLSNGGVGFALDKYNKKLISASTIALLGRVQKDIISGKVKVPSE